MSIFKRFKKSYSLLLLVNLLQIAIVVILYNTTERVIKTDKNERNLNKITQHLDSVLISLKDAQRGERGFVISGKETYLETFFSAKNRLNRIIDDLETSLKEQNKVQQNLISSERLMKNALAKFDEIIKIRKEKGAVLEKLTRVDYEAKLFIDTFQNKIRPIENYEKEMLNNNVRESLSSLQEMVILLVISGFVIVVLIILLSINLIRNILKSEDLSLKLEGSEKKYNFLFELSVDGIIVADLNGIITDCNTAACKIFGYSKQELIGKSYHIIWPDEQKHLLPAKIIRDTKTGDRLIDRTYVKKDGTILYAEVYTKLIEINGISNVIAHIRDVTDKKQAQKAIAKSEEKYRNLFERSLAGIFRATTDGQIIECNAEYLKVLGYNSIDDIKKISTKSIYADPRDREKLIELLRERKEVKDYVMKLKKKDGSYVWVYDNVSLIYDEDLKKEVLFGTMVDITAQKEAEKEIELLAHSLESISECISITDENNIILYVNNAFVKTYGYSKEELIGRDISIVQPQPQEVPGIRSDILNLTKKGGWKGELINKRKDGSEFPVYLSTSIVKDSENNAIALIGVAMDITERKRAEEEIYRLNRIYTLLSNINQALVRIKDKRQLFETACKIAIDDGKFKMSWIGLFDEQSGELKVEYSHGFDDGYLDEVIVNKKSYSDGVKPISELTTTGKALIFNDIEKLDANLFWRQQALKRGYKSNIIFPLKVFGNIIGIYSLFSDQAGFFEEKEIKLLEEMSEDISFALETMELEKKRKESESLFYTLADNSPVGIFRTNASGYTTYVNPKWCQLAGMKAEEALGDGWLKAVHHEDRKRVSDSWHLATEEKKSSITEYRFLRPDGSIAWVMGQAIPELNSNGQINGYIGTITDITNIKLYEHELIKAKEVAEKANKLKDAFINIISHEIRTPLNGMLGLSSIIKENYASYITKEDEFLFTGIDISARRIIRTFDTILNYSRLQIGEYTGNFKEIDLYTICERIIHQNREAAEKKQLELIFDSKCVEAKIIGDEYSITEAVLNLVENAIKFTKKGFVKVTLSTGKTGGITIEVKDTGIGIDDEYLKHLFEPYRQEEMGYNRNYEGLGLGLALAKKFIEYNHGLLLVESKKGEGTIFTIKF
ncbi:PAS domain S-box protein [Stygiobacter electus]|uniref:histidine kinase n=1 Tax=Stygiobacter electus TaxID=3032292 RepID=A0AAE3P2T2_9BACT|nr:PAS domain S-box protein [Stygiobacter electus]MDF1612053.1 PAS domain S-box protein [Stygiobacter electus]